MIKCKSNYNSSFIAGFLEGDGTIYHTLVRNYIKYIIKFCNNNKKFLENIEKFIGKGSWYKQIYTNPNYSPTYYLSYNNQKMVKQIGTLLSKEYLSIYRKKQLKPILEKFKINSCHKKKPNKDWLKGFIAAEGGYWILKISRLHKINKVYEYKRFGISQNNLRTLLDIRTLLKKLGIKSYIYKIRKNYRLLISPKDNNIFINKLEVLL